MGTIFSSNPNNNTINKRIFPIRHYRNLHPEIDITETRYAIWNPKLHEEKFRYPAKEPAKDF